MEDIALPFTRLKAKDDINKQLKKVKTAEARRRLLKEISDEIEELRSDKSARVSTDKEQKAMSYIIEGMLHHMTDEIKKDYNAAFKSPLEERAPKLMLSCDRFAFKFRRYAFASSAMMYIVVLYLQLLVSR